MGFSGGSEVLCGHSAINSLFGGTIQTSFEFAFTNITINGIENKQVENNEMGIN